MGFKSNPSNVWSKLIIFLLLISYISILVYLCGKLNLWEDEFYTIDTTSGPFREFNHNLINLKISHQAILLFSKFGDILLTDFFC
jgi:hypothetical protein